MTRAASWGMTPTSASAPASARSKSSMARTNAWPENAWVKVSRAKLFPTRLTAIDAPGSLGCALELEEDRLARSPQPDVPPIHLGILGVEGGDQRLEAIRIGDRAGEGIVFDHLERGEEHARMQRLQEPAREDRDADLR